MVLKKNYSGPSALIDGGQTLETPAMRLVIDAASLCVRVEDKTRGNAHLTTVCPVDMALPFKGINIDPATMNDAGLRAGPGVQGEAGFRLPVRSGQRRR